MKTALLQLCSSDDPAENIPVITQMMREAAGAGAGFIATPEMTNCMSGSRSWQEDVLQSEADDQTLAALRTEAASLGVWLLIGSLGLKTTDADGRFANRCFVVDPGGRIAARYDKIHMFDVDVSPTETYRESAAYRPGDRAVTAQTPFGELGLTICYDVRFAHLHRALAKAGAEILTVPAAFSPVTGAAHWETLLRTRAIETGCYVLAPAQTGTHPTHTDKTRRTYGHTLAVAPWGEVLADAGTEPGITYVDLDRQEVAKARGRIAALSHDRPYQGPE
ncbi:carbon-nitrogen hydrolase family protein [Flavimaricola marinus]|uniref:2-oxoglutaramate amidase n=1 Tax=Flavimaricola marinus TaxID=1819565 RepID=A0A238LC66_9RHOB|nr:carbon-nitrogen hydrolase family protein [Flavimaricola marinus]SMY07153.1 2-oxoglutaramate amidase [Flavimaricola marinus]